MSSPRFTVAKMSPADAAKVIDCLQDRLVSLIDLDLTLKHVHWNVVGPNFIGVHQMLDTQVAAVRLMVDELAERIATMGGSPNGLPGNLVSTRRWDEYALGRADVLQHLAALDSVYEGITGSHRDAIELLEDLDKVTQDLLIGQTEQLEQFHWFVRAHLETAGGELRDRNGKGSPRTAARPRAAAKPAGRSRTRAASRN